GGVCAGTTPTELCISVACSTMLNGTVVLLPRGPIYPGTPETQFSWQGATAVCYHRGTLSARREGHSSPGLGRGMNGHFLHYALYVRTVHCALGRARIRAAQRESEGARALRT